MHDLDTIAEATLHEHGWDVLKATAALEAAILEDPALFRALTEPLVRNACYAVLSKKMRSHRATVWTAPNYDEAAESNRRRISAAAKTTLYDFPLLGGTVLLGDAVRPQVIDARDHYASISADAGWKSRWLLSVGNSLADDRTAVRAALTTEELVRLREQSK